MRRAVTSLALMILLQQLAACGQTGPLYLPGEEPPSRQEQPVLFPDNPQDNTDQP